MVSLKVNQKISYFLIFLVLTIGYVGLPLLPVVKAQYPNREPLSAFYADMYGAASSYASLDYTTTHNGNPSIRTGPDYVRGSREVDGAWISVSPGDHIVFSAWLKTDSSTDIYGARIGFDYCALTSAGYGIPCWPDGAGDGHPTDAENFYPGTGSIGWSTDWTLKTWDVYVPTTYYNYIRTFDEDGNLIVVPCDPVQIDSLVAIFDARSVTEPAYAWFSEPSLYVLSGPEPTPTPSPTPTSPPTPTPPGATPTPTPTSPTPTPLIPPSEGEFIIQSTQDFLIQSIDSGFTIQDIYTGISILFDVTSGVINGTGNVNATSASGIFLIGPNLNATLNVTSTDPTHFSLKNNGTAVTNGVITLVAGTGTAVTWQNTGPLVVAHYPAILNVAPFWQYFYAGNFLGFFQAIFLWSFIQQDILYGALCMLFLIPVYLKTKSLLLLCILWILLGGFFLALMPAISGLAIVFLVLGVSGLLWRLVHPN